MDRSPNPELGGVLREEQGWIGGGSFNPCNAAYVPPPPDRVPELMHDLVAYVNTDYHSPLTQAAVAHAQFETIHPFGDGNGRAGRALIHIVLQRRGLAPRFVPPISLVLSTWLDSYIEGLTGFRHEGPAESAQRDDALHPWLDLFASATRRACDDALRYSNRIDQLTDEWNKKLGRYRRGSALALLVAVLPGVPLLTPDKGSTADRTFPGSYPEAPSPNSSMPASCGSDPAAAHATESSKPPRSYACSPPWNAPSPPREATRAKRIQSVQSPTGPHPSTTGLARLIGSVWFKDVMLEPRQQAQTDQRTMASLTHLYRLLSDSRTLRSLRRGSPVPRGGTRRLEGQGHIVTGRSVDSLPSRATPWFSVRPEWLRKKATLPVHHKNGGPSANQ